MERGSEDEGTHVYSGAQQTLALMISAVDSPLYSSLRREIVFS